MIISQKYLRFDFSTFSHEQESDHYGQTYHGRKGAGKTKQLIDLINESAVSEAGSVVCIEAGDVLTFEAGLTNQIGLSGYLDQTFVWKAMDTDRENEVSGITIVPSDDTKTATVTVEETLVPGSYDIVAYSEKYDMAKGCTITMEEPYYYADSGNISMQAKLNSDDTWTSDKVSTGLVNYIEVKATLEDNTEAFEWLITNKNRLSVVEDVFTLTPVTTSGAEQTVKVAAITGIDIKPGDYNVVAVAKDGSVKAQPINLDITGDLNIIIDTFANGTTEGIKTNLSVENKTVTVDVSERPVLVFCE